MKLKNINSVSLFATLSLVFLTASFLSFVPPRYPAFGIKTVVIDAGHGGHDPGCNGHKFKEKDVALSIALQFGSFIEKHMKDVKVVYTRNKDFFVELNERAAIANKNKADLFVSIHCNASENKSAFGSETYAMGLHKTKGNLEVAKRENSSILMENDYKKTYNNFDPNSDEGYILMSIQQNAFLDQSLNFASKVQKNLKDKAGRTDKGVKQAGFLVLWKSAMPSVLIETGFLTNRGEHDFLSSDVGQKYMAMSIFRAFRQYKDEVEGRFVKYDDEFENLEAYNPDKYKIELKEEHDTTSNPVKDEKTDNSVKDSTENKQSTDVKELFDKIDPEKGVWFRVQFYATDIKMKSGNDKFKDIPDVMEYEAGGIYKYTAGNFKKPEDAKKLQGELRKNGFPDAFIVAFSDGKRISYNDAIKLINE